MGLMTIGKYDNYLTSQDKIDPDFQCLIDCKDNICKNLNVTFDQFELSMGMSGDFERAVCQNLTQLLHWTYKFFL